MFKDKKASPTSTMSNVELIKAVRAFFTDDGVLETDVVSRKANAMALIYEMATRWYQDNCALAGRLVGGEDVWYLDEEKGSIRRANVCTALYREGILYSVGIDYADGDFDELPGACFGTHLFKSEKAALLALIKVKKKSDD